MNRRNLLLGALSLFLLAAAPEGAPPAVSVIPAVQGTLAATILVTGTLVARDEVLVSPQIDGLAITAINVGGRQPGGCWPGACQPFA